MRVRIAFLVLGMTVMAGCDSRRSKASASDIMALLDAADAKKPLNVLALQGVLNAKHARAFLGAESANWKSLEQGMGEDAVKFPDELQRLLTLGPSAVPHLVRLLDNDRYRTCAAAALGFIGSEDSSAALISCFVKHQWREETVSYRHTRVDTGGQLRASSTLEPSPVMEDAEFLEVLTASLIRAGTSDPGRLVEETMAALDSVVSRVQRREPLISETEEARGDEIITHYVSCGELAALARGLRVLAWIGGHSAAPAFRRALGSGIREVYLHALTFARWYGAPELLDALKPHLEDNSTLAAPVTVGHLAASAVVAIHDREWDQPIESLSKERADRVLARAKQVCAARDN